MIPRYKIVFKIEPNFLKKEILSNLLFQKEIWSYIIKTNKVWKHTLFLRRPTITRIIFIKEIERRQRDNGELDSEGVSIPGGTQFPETPPEKQKL